MNKLFTLPSFLLLFIANTQLYAQENLPEYGKIDTTDLLMKDCPFDNGADAMNLINYENTEFEVTQNGYYIDIERWVRIKIFKPSGFVHASVVVPFISKDRLIKIMDVSAFTYNIDENGNITRQKLEKKDIFEEKSNNDAGTMRFALSGVKPGSVIEFKYTIEENNLLHLDPWFFQDVIPTRLSICKLNYNSDEYINMHVLASLPFEHTSDSVKALDGHYKKIEQSYTMRDVPAFRVEPMMSSLNDNLQRIEFAVLTSLGSYRRSFAALSPTDKWKWYNLTLLVSYDFGELFTEEIPGTKAKLDSVKKIPSDGEKIKAIYEWVRSTVKWDNTTSVYADDLKTVWTDKKGGKAEINLIILNLLRKAGIQCYPLLTSTKQHGKTDTMFASLSQFNGVNILAFDSIGHYILDGTQKYQSYNVPPYNILNSFAFLVDATNNRWVYVDDTRELMRNVISVKASIDSNGLLSGEVNTFYYDYAKVDVLSSSKKEGTTVPKDLLDQDFTDLKIDSLKEDNVDDPQLPLVKSFKFKLEMQQSGDYYFLDPFFLSPFKKNPFVDSMRTTSIDFGSNQYYAVNMFISLPLNITVSDLPANKEIRLADSSFSFGRLTARQGDAVVVRSHLEILNPVYQVEDYPFLKQLFAKMYALLNERIVFKKNN